MIEKKTNKYPKHVKICSIEHENWGFLFDEMSCAQYY